MPHANSKSLLLMLLTLCLASVALAGPLQVGATLGTDYEKLVATNPSFNGPVQYDGAVVFRDYGPFALWLSEETLCPAVTVHWLVEHTFDNLGGSISFDEDDALPTNLQVDPDMYRQADTPNHGEFDRGHMTPRFDMDSIADEEASYFTTNICPQLSTLNGGNWRAIESHVRDTTAMQTAGGADRALVLTGPIFTQAINVRIPTASMSFNPTVAVPDGFFKIAAYCGDDMIVDSIQVFVWMQVSPKPASYYEDTSITTVAQIEDLTGLYFRDIGTPVINSYSPTPVPLGGGTVQLRGSFINDATSVTINGNAASFVVMGDDLNVTFPSGMSSLTVDVEVTTPSGSAMIQVLYEAGVLVPAPMIFDAMPMTLPISGAQVRLTGMALEHVTSVAGNARPLAYSYDNTDLLVSVPAGASGASITIGVTSPGGADVIGLMYETIAPRPIIRELIPGIMPAAGGELRLRGDHLALVTQVEHDGGAIALRKEGAELIVAMPSRTSAGSEVIAIFTADHAVNLNVPYAAPVAGGGMSTNGSRDSDDSSGCALRVPGGKPLILLVLLFFAAWWLRKRRAM